MSVLGLRSSHWDLLYPWMAGLVALATVIALWPALPAFVPEVSLPEPQGQMLRLSFSPNRGQAKPGIQYVAGVPGMRAAFFDQGFDITLPVAAAVEEDRAPGEVAGSTGESFALRVRFADPNPGLVIEPGPALTGRTNYIRGNDPGQWITNVPSYAALTYRNLYPGIDLYYDGSDGLLKGTFVVAAGADPAQIRWRYDGAQGVTTESTSGDLFVQVADQARIVERAPLAWQEIGGQRVAVPVSFSLAGDGHVGFALPQGYDTALPLVVDPTIVYETILDEGGLESGQDIAVDSAGNAYVLAWAATAQNNILIVKLAPDGEVLFTTYLGGSASDVGTAIAVNDTGGIYITGWSSSADFPLLDPLPAHGTLDGPSDAFITRLSAVDGTLEFGTYWGGTRNERGRDLVVGSNGDLYLTGGTDSVDFPTVDPIQPNLSLLTCFCFDSFVTRISADESSVLYSTYLGGALTDEGLAIGLDGDHNIYVAGDTQSEDFPTELPIQATYGGGSADVFIARIASDGSQLDFSTYLGGNERDSVRRIAVDGQNNVVAAGIARSADFPTTGGAYQPQFAGGILDCGSPPFTPRRNCDDVFVAKLTSGGQFVYSTYIGGGLDEEGRGVAVDSAGNAYVVGYTSSADFPVPGGDPLSGAEMFFSKLSTDGSQLLYTEIIETPSPTAGHGIAVGSDNDVYVTGAQNVPADLYVARFSEGPTPSCPDFVDPPGVGVEDITLVAEHWDETPDSPTWDPRFNLDEDLRISIADVLVVSSYWGQECP